MTGYSVEYLGPEGSFTHAAAQELLPTIHDMLARTGAMDADDEREAQLQPAEQACDILDAVNQGKSFGVIAWENNVEGYVVPNLDGLIDAHHVVGCARMSIDIEFDAFTLPDDIEAMTTVSAHPHGLAQCQQFIKSRQLEEIPASSNAAACRDIESGQIALGPRICGDLYGLTTLASGVQDYQGSRTDFLLLAPRKLANRALFTGDDTSHDFESIVAFIPLSTGPGVLAGVLDILRDAGLNMTSFISRPIKGHDGTYSFIATIDAAPWQPHLAKVLESIIQKGDWVKTLAVYARRERPNPPVTEWMLPAGGAGGRAGQTPSATLAQCKSQFI